MYALRGAARRARVRDVRPRLRARRHRLALPRARAALGGGLAVALAALLYTHNWALFFAAGCGRDVAGAAARAARGETRRELLRDGADRLRRRARCCSLPWLPTLALPGAAHGRAVVAPRPGSTTCSRCPARLLGHGRPARAAAGRGRGRGRAAGPRARAASPPRGRALLAIGGLSVATVLVAWPPRRSRPRGPRRYLAVALPPLLLGVAGGLAHAGRLGLVGALVVALLWAGDGAPAEKSNVRDDRGGDRARACGPATSSSPPSPSRSRCSATTCPTGLRYATLWGAGRRPRRDRLARRRRAPARDQRRRATSSR